MKKSWRLEDDSLREVIWDSSGKFLLALAGLALRPEVRAFGMGVFFTVYYAIMLATPPAAGAIFDATGQPQGPIWLAMALFASVVPLALSFEMFRSGASATLQEERVS